MISRQQAMADLIAVPFVPDKCGGPSAAIFDAVESLITALGSDDIAPLILDSVLVGRLTLEAAHVYLDIAVWSGTDNGTAMSATLERWLEQADDRTAVELGLEQSSRNGILQPKSRQVRVLSQVAERFPDLRTRCHALIARKDWPEPDGTVGA